MSTPDFVRTWDPDDHFHIQAEDSVRDGWHRATCHHCDWGSSGTEDVVEEAGREHIDQVHAAFLDEQQAGQATVDTWNANHRPGTLVRWTGPGADPIVARTVGPAFALAAGGPAVELEGHPGIRYALWACEPLDERALHGAGPLLVAGLPGDGRPTHRVQFRFPARPGHPYVQDQADTLVGHRTTITVMGHDFTGTFVAAVVDDDGQLVITAEVGP